MKPGPNFQQASDTTIQVDLTGCRLRDAAQYFEQSRFPGAISPDDSEDFRALDIKRNVLKRPELFSARSPQTPGKQITECLAQSRRAVLLRIDAVSFAD